tara:strand:+ start:735 stop:1274 length:540 start_codon:yes stop_codon:yes gene_type:complete
MSKDPKKKSRFRHIGNIAVFTPTEDDVATAYSRSCKMGIPGNSIMKGQGRMTGLLGEIAVNTYLPQSHYVGDSVWTHDLVHKEKNIEVKSKICSGIPKPEYTAFVNGKKDMKPENDTFFFTRVRRDFMQVYLVGWIPTKLFLKKADFVSVGDEAENGFQYKSPGYDILIEQLYAPRSLR